MLIPHHRIFLWLSVKQRRMYSATVFQTNLNDLSYTALHLGVVKNLCGDVILGQDFQKEHRSVIIKFGGAKPE